MPCDSAETGTGGGEGALNKLPPRRVLAPSPVPRTDRSVTVRVEGRPGDRVELLVSSEHQVVLARAPEAGLRIVGQPLLPPIRLGSLGGEGAALTHELPLAALLFAPRASSFYLQARFKDVEGAVIWGSGCALRLLDDRRSPALDPGRPGA